MPNPEDYGIKTHYEALEFMKSLGFKTNPNNRLVSDVNGILEFIDEKDGIKYYNDSKATNTHATSAALNSFASNIILLAGGYDKKISFDDLKVYDDRVKCCVAFGQTKEQFKSIFSNVVIKEDMQEAFDYATSIATAGDFVVLSPACASYDQFKNYEIRGEQFKEMVKAYLKG